MGLRRTLSHRLARRLGRTRFVRRAVEEDANLDAFKERPRPRLVVGLVLIALSFVVGWPGVAAFSIAAVHTGDVRLFLFGGPAAYGLSWAIWGVGMLLTGPDTYKYGRIFLRWLARDFVERHDGAPAGELPQEPEGGASVGDAGEQEAVTEAAEDDELDLCRKASEEGTAETGLPRQ